ncbi:MAG: FapA family protein [Desulfovibrio sp.]|nr:FapA family protein [Desulfovibrio sp.]
MRYYLQHFFDPDFDHTNRKPDENAIRKNTLDLFNLGYVQNVIKGQILAQIVPLDSLAQRPDPRFILDAVDFPAGQNTYIDPEYPQYLLAASNGYVFYNEGRITVKSLLNVRQDVSFHTGNINFVGDMAIHGAIRSGFSILGNNVRISGVVEGGIAHSASNMLVDGGVRGNTSDHCLVDSGGKLMINFLEKAEARARGNIVINKYCLYSTVYAGNNMLVKEQLYGGTINVFSSIYVGKQLGNKAGIPTSVFIGYDPLIIRRMEKQEAFISTLTQSITHLKAITKDLPPEANDATIKLQQLMQQRANIIAQRRAYAKKLFDDEHTINACRLIVPGIVYPGVEISIGKFFRPIEKPYENVVFHLQDSEIVSGPISSAQPTLNRG